MHLLWHWFCCFFKLGFCSFRCCCIGGSGMISIHYGQVSSPRHWLKPCPFLYLKVTRQWKHATGEAGCSLFLWVYACNYIYMFMYVCVCVHAYMLLFVDSCRTSNKNVSPVFCWNGWVTNPTEWLLNRQVLTVMQIIAQSHPCLSGPPPSLSTHPGPGLLSLQHRLLCHCFLSGGIRPLCEESNILSLVPEGDRAPACNSNSEKDFILCDRGCIWRDPFLTTARLACIWVVGTVRTSLGMKEASLRVPIMRTGPAGQWCVNFSR